MDKYSRWSYNKTNIARAPEMIYDLMASNTGNDIAITLISDAHIIRTTLLSAHDIGSDKKETMMSAKKKTTQQLRMVGYQKIGSINRNELSCLSAHWKKVRSPDFSGFSLTEKVRRIMADLCKIAKIPVPDFDGNDVNQNAILYMEEQFKIKQSWCW